MWLEASILRQRESNTTTLADCASLRRRGEPQPQPQPQQQQQQPPHADQEARRASFEPSGWLWNRTEVEVPPGAAAHASARRRRRRPEGMQGSQRRAFVIQADPGLRSHMAEAPAGRCRKQKPTVTALWPWRHVKIEGRSLRFFENESDTQPRGSSIEDVTGCLIGRERETFRVDSEPGE